MLKTLQFAVKSTHKMSKFFEGSLQIKQTDLNLDLTLLGGQSFRWQKVIPPASKDTQWCGVAYNAYWVLTQNNNAVTYKVFPHASEAQSNAAHFRLLIKRYFRADFDLPAHVQQWRKAHKHFAEIATHLKAVRVLDQEPLENILSFICSQNNHIKRISTMIQWLCTKYGCKIEHVDSSAEYTFPTLAALLEQAKNLETDLRAAKFGYRAKFIAQTVTKINELGGDAWFEKLRELPYTEARLELVKLPGIGFKVADCICLMSLNHLESVPIDTHIFKIAQSAYMPKELGKIKSVTPKIYDEIAAHFRHIYGDYAGWAQAVLFCSELQQFQTEKEVAKASAVAKKRKCK